MLETLPSELLPAHISWFDRLMQYLGFFSKCLCLQANRLIENIRVSLNNGWLSEDEAHALEHEHNTWRRICRQLKGRQKVSPARKAHTLRMCLEKRAIRRKIADFYQFQDVLHTLNQPEMWQQWEAQSTQSTAVKQLRHKWLAICDVAGLQNHQAIIIWHALESLRQHLETTASCKPWQLMWQKKNFRERYLAYTKRTLRSISHLQSQLAHYLYFCLVAHDKNPNKHPITWFLAELNHACPTSLSTPDTLPNKAISQKERQATYNILHSSHLNRRLQQHHQHRNISLQGYMWHGEWLWLPSDLVKWLSGLRLQPWHHDFITWLQDYATEKYDNTRMLFKTVTHDQSPRTIEEQLAWLTQLNACHDVIQQWQSSTNKQIKQCHYKPLRAFHRRSLTIYQSWLMQQQQRLHAYMHDALNKLWKLSKQQQHQWMQTMDILPAYHLIKDIQANFTQEDNDSTATQLLEFAGSMVLVYTMASQQHTTATTYQKILDHVTPNQHPPSTLQQLLCQSIQQHHNHLRQQCSAKIDSLVTYTVEHDSPRNTIHLLSLIIAILITIGDEHWVHNQLSILLLMHLKHQLHKLPKSLPSLGRTQINEDTLSICIGHTVYLGQALDLWIQSMRQHRCKDAWDSYRFQAKQLYQCVSQQCFSMWLEQETNDINHTSINLINKQNNPHLLIWYTQRIEKMAHQTSTSDRPDHILTACDRSIMQEHNTTLLPLQNILEACYLLFWLTTMINHNSRNHHFFNILRNTITTIASLLKHPQNLYPLNHLATIRQTMAALDTCGNPHNNQPTETRPSHEHTTATKAGMFGQHTRLQQTLSKTQLMHAHTESP